MHEIYFLALFCQTSMYFNFFLSVVIYQYICQSSVVEGISQNLQDLDKHGKNCDHNNHIRELLLNKNASICEIIKVGAT